MAKSIIKNSRKVHAGPSTDPSLDNRVYYLENNEYKITYYEVVSGASGTLTVPTSATINEGEFGSSGNAILSEIDVNQKPTFKSPQTAGGVIVTANLNATTGAWLASGVYTSSNVALIYSVSILAKDYQNLDYDRIVESEELDYDLATQAAVDTGTVNDQIVTPKTLANSNWAFTTFKVLATTLTGLNTSLTGVITSSDTILQAFGRLQYQISNLGSTYEILSNKSSSYTVSSTTTYANTKALVDGLATKIDKLNLTDIVSLCTITGWAVGYTANIDRYDLGDAYYVTGRITGTSNSTTTSVVLPNTNNGHYLTSTHIGRNNGTIFGTAVWILPASSATITFYTNLSAGTYSNIGTKEVNFSLMIKK